MLSLASNLEDPNWDYWESCFPNGIGASAFSSPHFQRLVRLQLGDEWQHKFLTANAKGGTKLHLPVFAVQNKRTRRWLVKTHPMAAFVMPLEGDKTGPGGSDIESALVDAARSPRVTAFQWWLPPWRSSVSDSHPFTQGNSENSKTYYWTGELRRAPSSTYVMTVDKPAEQYLKEHVSESQRRHVRQSLNRGLELVTEPSREQVREYYQLYVKVWDERGWRGDRLCEAFFHGIRRDLSKGGELLLMYHHDKLVGGGFLLYDRYAVHYCQSSIDRDAKKVYPACILYMHALEQATARGLRFIDLGGVNPGNKGLIRFKESWGAQETSGTAVSWHSAASSPKEKLLDLLAG